VGACCANGEETYGRGTVKVAANQMVVSGREEKEKVDTPIIVKGYRNNYSYNRTVKDSLKERGQKVYAGVQPFI
jgi:hypothetical protein